MTSAAVPHLLEHVVYKPILERGEHHLVPGRHGEAEHRQAPAGLLRPAQGKLAPSLVFRDALILPLQLGVQELESLAHGLSAAVEGGERIVVLCDKVALPREDGIADCGKVLIEVRRHRLVQLVNVRLRPGGADGVDVLEQQMEVPP